MTRCRYCHADTDDDYHYGTCPAVAYALGPSDLDHSISQRASAANKYRLAKDAEGRKICRCGRGPVAYRGYCRACSTANVRERRAQLRAERTAA